MLKQKKATGVTTFTMPSDLEIAATRVFDAPRKLMWDMWTKPEHVQQWMLGPEGWTMPICEIDLRPGGAWRWVWRRKNGKEMEMKGVYKVVEAPKRLVNTERWGPEWPETINTLVLTDEGGKTKTVSTVLFPSKAARDAAAETGMRDGWSVSYDRLDEYLVTKS